MPAALVAVLPHDPGGASARVVTHGSLEARWFAPRGPVPRQAQHDRPQVYVIVRGRGTFNCDGEREPFGPGDMIWVPAGGVHCFEDHTRDLAVWGILYEPGPGRQAG